MDYAGRKFKREELEHELYWEEQELKEEARIKREKAWQNKLAKEKQRLQNLKDLQNENN